MGIVMSSIMIPEIKPNTKYTGGDRICPDVVGVLEVMLCPDRPGVMLGSGVPLAGCTGQPVATEDDEAADDCVVVQEYVPKSK
jgi:hypothetical protein